MFWKKVVFILNIKFGFSWVSQLDGYMARRLGIHSVLGSYLDPLADKVSIERAYLHFILMCG